LDGVDDGADQLDGGVLVGMGGELALEGRAVGVAQLGVDVDLADATAGGGGVGVVGGAAAFLRELGVTPGAYRAQLRTTGIKDDRRSRDELDIWPDTFHRVPVSPQG
jgi:hypothetical protein